MLNIPAGWKPIESAPKDGTEILAWREDCGQFIALYTSADAFPMTQDELDAWDEETLFAKDWFTQWPQAYRLEGIEVPTHWMPLPAAPGAETGAHALPASVAPGDAQDAVIAGALFDLMGFLTTLDEPVALGSTEEAAIAVELLQRWAAKRGLNLDDADVKGWNERRTAPAAGDALPTIKGAAITGGYVVVTPAGWGEDKAQKVRDAILRLFPVDPAYRPKPEDAQVPQQGEA